jgi:hypothetical protein
MILTSVRNKLNIEHKIESSVSLNFKSFLATENTEYKVEFINSIYLEDVLFLGDNQKKWKELLILIKEYNKKESQLSYKCSSPLFYISEGIENEIEELCKEAKEIELEIQGLKDYIENEKIKISFNIKIKKIKRKNRDLAVSDQHILKEIVLKPKIKIKKENHSEYEAHGKITSYTYLEFCFEEKDLNAIKEYLKNEAMNLIILSTKENRRFAF